ncbi:MAG: NAD-dependent epimerase/dehydratase family protein [Kofleriaceae bacterium]
MLWLSSVGTRTPKLSSARDLGTIRRKLAEFARGAQHVENDLWVATPLVLPLPHNPAARLFNRYLLRAYIRALRLRLGIDAFQLWTFLPTVADYCELGQDLTVYYCVDEWSMFGYLDREATVAAERQLLAKTDAVFAINTALADAKRAVVPDTFVSPHGVDHALFARALDPATAIPADLAAIPGPRIGFYGTLREWVDLELVAQVARTRPDWSIVLIGQQLSDVSAVTGLANVHLLGQKRHDELPAYCKGFDVGIIPYRIDERMAFVNPLKLREYLSAGLPVVSTPVPEVERYAHVCHVAGDADGFVAAIERALAETGPADRATRSHAMRSETWEARVADVVRRVDEVTDRKRGTIPLPLSERVAFLVTGGSGSLGGAVVTRLLAEGHRVRVMVRRLPEHPVPGVEYAIGDLGDPDAVDRAVHGAETVIHAGAAMKGGWPEHQRTTIAGTQHVIEACTRYDVRQLVHISSMSVVDCAGSEGRTIDEHTPLEPRAQDRGAYTRAKLAAESLVTTAAARGLPAVILRPGQIFGGGIPLVTGAVARGAGARWVVLGDGSIELPLVYIDDVVDAILAAVGKRLTGGEIVQIIDPEPLTQTEVLELAGGGRKVVSIPRSVVFTLGQLTELGLALVHRQSPIAKYRLRSALAKLTYRSDRAAEVLGWQPRVGVRNGIAKEIR